MGHTFRWSVVVKSTHTHTHTWFFTTHTPTVTLELLLFTREETKDSAIRTIGQGVFCALQHMAGCGARVEWAPHASPETDATVRPVLKHGPRSSTGLQVAARQVRVAQRKQLRLVGRCPLPILEGGGCTTGQLSTRRKFDLARAANALGPGRLVEQMSSPVETRKMVNYVRTW